VLISRIKQEIGRDYRLLFSESEEFFEKCKNQEITVLISELFLNEVKKITKLTEEDVLEILEKDLELSILKIKINKNDLIKANELNTHKTDALHAAIAINNECDALITWNTKDFEMIKELRVLTPEEFISF